MKKEKEKLNKLTCDVEMSFIDGWVRKEYAGVTRMDLDRNLFYKVKKYKECPNCWVVFPRLDCLGIITKAILNQKNHYEES